MTTDMFFARAKAALRGQRPAPVPVPAPGTIMVSRDGQSFVSYPSPVAVPAPAAPMPAAQYRGQGAPVSLEKKPADVETISLGPRASFITTPQIDAHGTSEEKIGPRGGPASLVGGL